MRWPAVRILTAVGLAIALAGCGKKKGQRPPPAAKPVSPAIIEPGPAPVARGQLPSPAGTPTDTSPAIDAGVKAQHRR